MKTRLDQPHLEPMRYDYALLHSLYKKHNRERNYALIAYLLQLIVVLFFTGFFLLRVYDAITLRGNLFNQMVDHFVEDLLK